MFVKCFLCLKCLTRIPPGAKQVGYFLDYKDFQDMYKSVSYPLPKNLFSKTDLLRSFDVKSQLIKTDIHLLSYANRSCPVCSDSIFIFGIRFATHNSGIFALTSAAGIGGLTAFPHRLTCSLLGYVLPV